MDESIFAALEGFDGIWRRVTAPGDAASVLQPAPGHAQAADSYGTALCGLVLDAAGREAELSSLARRIKSAQRQLSRLAARQAQRRRLLETEAFLLTGEAVRPASAESGYSGPAPTAGSRSCACTRAQAFRHSQHPGVLTALRRVCLSADASAETLLRLAAQCGSGVSRVYLRLAEGERELSAELRRMMAAML